MRILIVDQCSASKDHSDGVDPLELDDIEGSPEEAISSSDLNGIEAADLYTGKQQRRIDTAVRNLRQKGHEVDRFFVSAGFGLVRETERLPPYNVTFSGMNNERIRQRGEELGITDKLVDQVGKDRYELAFFALGSDYYRAMDIEQVLASVPKETTVIMFNREEDEEEWGNVLSIPARTEEARENGSTVIGLKGTYLERFASRLDEGSVEIDEEVIRDYCESSETSQTNFDEYD